ncbi:unnamed protein product [Pieris macdunnoughi]|uniref:Insect cytokine uENF1 n=1 Tax=Pieris macdunnoughi TaxID=345717 RepID=A0A821X6B0_9NEOP|nr:unnamed protein product [Pieris macdunnoughi]
MTRPLQLLVLHIILYSLCADAAPFSPEDLIGIFANPIRDFLKLSIRVSEVETTTKKDGVTPQTKMIDVPPNILSCEDGSMMDKNGVCRRPW